MRKWTEDDPDANPEAPGYPPYEYMHQSTKLIDRGRAQFERDTRSIEETKRDAEHSLVVITILLAVILATAFYGAIWLTIWAGHAMGVPR
jgi:hypothetical protein